MAYLHCQLAKGLKVSSRNGLHHNLHPSRDDNISSVLQEWNKDVYCLYTYLHVQCLFTCICVHNRLRILFELERLSDWVYFTRHQVTFTQYINTMYTRQCKVHTSIQVHTLIQSTHVNTSTYVNTKYTRQYKVHTSIQCTYVNTKYTHQYKVHTSIQSTYINTKYIRQYNVHTSIQCTYVNTKYIRQYNVHYAI